MLVIYYYFKMQMRAGRIAGTPHFRDFLPLKDGIALAYKQFAAMRIDGYDVVIVLYADTIAIQIIPTGKNDIAVSCRIYRLTMLVADVDALVV